MSATPADEATAGAAPDAARVAMRGMSPAVPMTPGRVQCARMRFGFVMRSNDRRERYRSGGQKPGQKSPS